MIYSSGSVKAIVNDNVIEDSSWDLQSVNDNEFNMDMKLNGKRYELRNFDINDFGKMIGNPHNTKDIDSDEIFTPRFVTIKPYPKYSYKKTRSNKSGRSKCNTGSPKRKRLHSRKHLFIGNTEDKCKSKSKKGTTKSKKNMKSKRGKGEKSRQSNSSSRKPNTRTNIRSNANINKDTVY